ncbi:hypothetical protein [Niabella hirudinis]|uniref:hypothetical protein n=1 Tax=Niabella hirudinis TaxID=1285929 RepID=UPI003EBFA4C2
MGKVIRTSASRIPVFPEPLRNPSENRSPADHTDHYNPAKSLVSTGQEPFDKDGTPLFQGSIIFCNGYLSDPVKNIGANANAIMDFNPDEDRWYVFRGANADESNPADDEDIFTPGELNGRLPEAQREDPKQADRLMQLNRGGFTKENIKQMIWAKDPRPVFSYGPAEWSWGYWNMKSNQYNGTNTYASYFNAQGNEYFINGSHGLGSGAAHRIDHGVLQGYRWAATSWGILDRKSFDGVSDPAFKEILKGYTPPYRPVTVLGHSQGCACAAGVVLGILNYAAKLGWEQVPVNILFLSPNQPVGLTGEEYQNFLAWKKDYLQVDKTVLTLWNKDPAKNARSYIDGLAGLFNETYNKLRHEEGIYEHLKKITGNWEAYKSRSVQFDFTNDRGDPVIRCGDIPGISSACDPRGDCTLLSFEVYPLGTDLEKTVASKADKKQFLVYDVDGQTHLGYLFLPPFIANRRIEFDDWEEQVWTDYEVLVMDYARSFLRYLKLKHYYAAACGRGFDPGAVTSLNATLKGLYVKKLKEVASSLSGLYQRFFAPAVGTRKMDLHTVVYCNYIASLVDYAALQEADLYAHFSPVPLLTNRKILDDWNYERDTIGVTTNIWERILKVGGKKFYRVEKKRIENDKHDRYIYERLDFRNDSEAIKKETCSQKKSIPTSAGDTDYINNLIKKYSKK